MENDNPEQENVENSVKTNKLKSFIKRNKKALTIGAVLLVVIVAALLIVGGRNNQSNNVSVESQEESELSETDQAQEPQVANYFISSDQLGSDYEMIVAESVQEDQDYSNKETGWYVNFWRVSSENGEVSETYITRVETGSEINPYVYVEVSDDASFATVNLMNGDVVGIDLNSNEQSTVYEGGNKTLITGLSSDGNMLFVNDSKHTDEVTSSYSGELKLINLENNNTVSTVSANSATQLEPVHFLGDNRVLLNGCFGSEAIKCQVAVANFDNKTLDPIFVDSLSGGQDAIADKTTMNGSPYLFSYGDFIENSCSAFFSLENYKIYDTEENLVATAGFEGKSVSLIYINPSNNQALMSYGEVIQDEGIDLNSNKCQETWKNQTYFTYDLNQATASSEIDPTQTLSEWGTTQAWVYSRITNDGLIEDDSDNIEYGELGDGPSSDVKWIKL